jgi:hypothetical protein
VLRELPPDILRSSRPISFIFGSDFDNFSCNEASSNDSFENSESGDDGGLWTLLGWISEDCWAVLSQFSKGVVTTYHCRRLVRLSRNMRTRARLLLRRPIGEI